MTAVIPRIINIFKILLPTIFPIVIPALLSNAAVMLTAASGKLVPMATIVSPITSCGIPSFFAMLAAPSTNQSAPFTSRKNPTSKINTCTIILPTSFLFYLQQVYKKRLLLHCSKSLAVSSLSELFFNNCTDEEVHLFWSATPFYWVHFTKVIFKSQLQIFTNVQLLS